MGPLRIDRVLGFEHGIPPVFGAIAAAAGLTFLFFGWRLHRITIAIAGFAIGALLGQLVTNWIQVPRLWGIMVGGCSLALLADPLYRVVVFILAGLALGSVAGETVRLVAPSSFLWGFVPGFVLGGLLSLWQLRLLVILSSAFLGAIALFWGGAVSVGAWLFKPAATFHARHPLATLVVVGLAFIVGCTIQFRFAPKSKKWDDEAKEE